MTLPSIVVAELSEVIDRTRTSYTLWRELVLPENVATYREALENGREFFEATANAHFATTIVSICQVMEASSHVVSIPNVLDQLRVSHGALVVSLESKIRPHESIFQHISRIRSKVYAHRDHDLGPEMIFAAAPITPDSLGACVDVISAVASELCYALQLSMHPGSVYDSVDASARLAVDQLHAVLEALSNKSLECSRARYSTLS